MTIQKLLLRIVFGSLALAACCGAVAMIFAGHDTLWRIVWTCVATALGAFLLFGSSSVAEREVTRLAGALATALIVAEYLLTLAQIWDVFGSANDQAGFTILALALTGIPAIVCLVMLARPLTTIAARLGLGVCGADLALLLIGAWGSGWGQPQFDDNRWFGISWSLAAFGFLAVVSLVGAGLDRRDWRWAGVAAAGAGVAIATYRIVLAIQAPSSLLVCVTTVAVVVAHANAMMLCPLRPAQRWLLASTIGAAIATGIFVDLASVTRPWQQDMLGRLAGAAAIIAGCGTLALLVLARINRSLAPPGTTVSEVHDIALVCPLCGTRQRVPLGAGRCPACSLGIAIRLEA